MEQRQLGRRSNHGVVGFQQRFALPRPRLIDALDNAFRQCPAVLIEARAGQGKSWLASQYLAQWDGANCWFDAGESQGHTLLALWAALAQSLAQMPAAPRAADLPLCPQERCDALLAALQRGLGGRDGGRRLLLVLDGAEALAAPAPGLRLLERLIGAADVGLRLLLSARPGTAARLAGTAAGRRPALLDGAMLDFSTDELLHYCERAHGICPAPVWVERLFAETRGWPQGLVTLAPLLVDGLCHGDAGDAASEAATRRRREQIDARLCDYFSTTLLQPLEPAARHRLCRRTLFDSGDEALAAELLGATDGAADNIEGGGFIDSAGRLHPQLRRALSALAPGELLASERRELRLRAAQRLHALGDWSGSARYALAVDELPLAERALAASRGGLLSDGGGNGLCRALLRAGGGHLADYPQLLMHRASLCRSVRVGDCVSCPAAGGACGELDPALAVDALERAVRLFAERGERHGELLALGELLRQLVLLDGRHGAAMPSYQRALSLQRQLRASDADRAAETGPGEGGNDAAAQTCGADCSAAATARSRLSAALGIAGLLLHGDQHNALRQLDAAVALAVGEADLLAEVDARCLRLQALLLVGRSAAASDDLEALQASFQAPAAAALIGPELRIRTLLAQLEWLWLRGECGAFGDDCKRRLESLLVQLPAGLTSRASARERLLLRRIEQQLGGGDLAAAEQSLHAPLQAPRSAGNDLLRGHLLARRALLHALAGREAAARSDAREAADLHWASGGHCQILDSHLALGAVYLQLGDWQEAETRLNEALRGATRFGLRALQAGALLQRALLWLRCGNLESAAADVADWLGVMREQQLRRCPGWLPESAEAVLEFALAQGLDVALVRELAASAGRGFDECGRAVPLLRVRSLGVFEFAIDGTTRLVQSDFTPAQRNLLALLLANPERALAQSVIQLALWPDSPADKARSKLDTLLSRLRGLFNQHLGPWRAAPYLSLRRGVLSLENIAFDAAEFQRDGTAAIACLTNRPWEAEWRLCRALALWQGRFCLGVDTLYSVSDLRELLFDQYGQYCRDYAGLAERSGRLHDAAAQLWQHFQSSAADPELTDQLCALYARLRRPDRVARVMREHRAAVDAAECELAQMRSA